MAAPALVTQEAPEMAAAIVYKKERVPGLETSHSLLILFIYRLRVISLFLYINPKLPRI